MESVSLPMNLRAITFYSNHGEDPCAHLRLCGPMRQLGIEVIEGKEGGEIYPERASLGDLVFVQRDFPRELETYEAVIAQARQKNKKVVFDLDDLLFMLPDDHPERKDRDYVESLLPMLQAMCDADLVTVSTQKIKDALNGLINECCRFAQFL